MPQNATKIFKNLTKKLSFFKAHSDFPAIQLSNSRDAHVPEKVGSFEGPLRRALEAGLEPERIVNIEKI